MIENFTPLPALAGGALIGLAASILLLAHGQIAGISGILGGVISRRAEARWRIAFLIGIAIGGAGVAALWPQAISMAGSRSLPLLLLAGLLVGFGTRLGTGCTSGHGVCGLSRRSPRSLVSVLVFMATGFATATALHLVLQ
jgi:uncharacterized membrane protein YedE/YeeE